MDDYVFIQDVHFAGEYLASHEQNCLQTYNSSYIGNGLN